eukprot:15366225-Ditylum_brightwellii.AAC.1
MNPVYNIWELVLVHEFGFTRGSLHLHHLDTVEQYDGSCTYEIDEILADLADDLANTVSKLEDSIQINHVHTKHFPKDNVNLLHSTTFSIWELFIKGFKGGKQVLKEYKDNIKYTDCKAGEQISYVLESQLGGNAVHPGSIPGDSVKPGGMPEMGYSSGINGMLESKDVMKKKELKKFKPSREHDLYECLINMTNHCIIFKCSAYCIQKKKKVKFGPKKHADSIGNIVCDKNGNEYIHVDDAYCRMYFGEDLKYDPSGGNDRTCGKPFLPYGEISFDRNGMH